MSTLLETKHLILRELEESDLDALYTIVSDPDVMRYVEDGEPLTHEQTAEWISLSRENYRTRGYDEYGVVAKSSGAVIGWCGLVSPSTAGGDAEINYGFAKSEWGKGYGKEAARAMLQWGFEQLGMDTILGTVDAANLASQAIFRHLKMEYIRFEMDEYNLPTMVYAIVNQEKRQQNQDEFRQRIIQQIYAAFETTRKDIPKQFAHTGRDARDVWNADFAFRNLLEVFGGKRWDKLVDEWTVIPAMSDVDDVELLTDEAFAYYLPAFMITALNSQGSWADISATLSKMSSIALQLSEKQLEAVIAFLDYYIQAAAKWSRKYFEDTQVYLMLHLDERKQKKAKP